MSSFDVEKLAVLATDYCVPVSEGKKVGKARAKSSGDASNDRRKSFE